MPLLGHTFAALPRRPLLRRNILPDVYRKLRRALFAAAASGESFEAAFADVPGNGFAERWLNRTHVFPLSAKKRDGAVSVVGPAGTLTRNPKQHDIHERRLKAERPGPKGHAARSLVLRYCQGFADPKDFRMIIYMWELRTLLVDTLSLKNGNCAIRVDKVP